MPTSSADPIRVVIIDDEALIRSGFRRILDGHAGIAVVGTADGVGATDLIKRERPDVVLLDIRMPVRTGLDVLEDLRGAELPTKVAILTTFDTDEHVAAALAAGAAGFLVKDTDPDLLPDIIRTVHGGGIVFSPIVSRSVVAGYLRPQPSHDAQLVASLTDREREILKLLARGDSSPEIGERLFLSAATVKTHISTILNKLGVEGRVTAALIAERAGLMRDQL